MRTVIAALAIAATLALTAAPVAAKTYSAERFDSRIRILPDGAIEVTETVVFRFETGSFDHVFREIRTRRTDGVEILHAEMDGRRLAFGTAADQVEVKGRSPVRVQWRFAPRSGTTHTFVLAYIARGVVYKAAGGDLLEWTALPTEHAYRIDASEIVVDAPASPAVRPAIESRRVDDASVEPLAQGVQVIARGIGKNGWVKTRLEFPEASLIAAAPRWQQQEIDARALAPRWFTAAGLILAVGLVLLFGLRQRYEVPPHGIDVSPGAVDAPPDTLRPALAGAVVSNGGVSLPHAMATLFTLADRGAITIAEEPKRWGHRMFTLHRNARSPIDPAPEEAVLLDVAFRKKDRVEERVSLSDARSRVSSGLRRFKQTVRQQLGELGLLDEERGRVRSRYATVAVVFLVLGLALVIPAAVGANQYKGWPFVVPAAVLALSALAAIVYGALTPLSNEGVRRAERWRAYQRHLKEVARDRAQVPRDGPGRLLPFAVALGLAGAWSKYVKHHPQHVPAWFNALGANADDGAFPAFIAAGGAADGGGGGGGGGAGGAAGGGASGAG